MKNILTIVILILLNMNLYSQWEVKNASELNETIYELKFYNSETGLAMGKGGLILKTSNAGESWERIENQIEGTIITFDFVSLDTIYLASNFFNGLAFESFIYKSENAGNDWEKIFTNEGDLSCVQFMNNNIGIASGYQKILRTQNGGETWETSYDITLNDFAYGEIREFEMVNDSIGFAIAFGRTLENTNPLLYSLVLKTEDEGVTWEVLFGFDSSLNALDFINTELGFVADENYTYKTIDGGVSWDTLTNLSNVVGFSIPSNNTIITVNRPSAYVLPENPPIITSFAISKSIDFGNTWEGEFRNGAHLETVFFLTDSIGYVAGDYSLIMKTETCGGEITGDYPWELFTKLNDLSINSKLKIYPNPARNSIRLREVSDAAIGIINLKIKTIGGVLIWSSYVEELSNLEVDISNFPGGVYILEMESKSEIRSGKFIKID